MDPSLVQFLIVIGWIIVACLVAPIIFGLVAIVTAAIVGRNEFRKGRRR